MIRVLIVDDSATVRAILSRRLSADAEIEIVGEASDGLEAIAQVGRLRPDVVTLDVEMPQMNGLHALERIMAEQPTPVVVVSKYTREGADVTLRALDLGAIDFVLKAGPEDPTSLEPVASELLPKLKLAAAANIAASVAAAGAKGGSGGLARPGNWRKAVVVIGSSTGGPRALRSLLSSLPADLPVPVLSVQHLPRGFTQAFAHSLNEEVGLTVKAAHDGSIIEPGLVLIAPGDSHMVLSAGGVIRLTRDEKECGVRPSVDITMESAVRTYGPATVGVILTGMGADGTRGAQLVKAAGGTVIAQDEKTCVVYGMPKSVIEAGCADRVLPLPKIGAEILRSIQQRPTATTGNSSGGRTAPPVLRPSGSRARPYDNADFTRLRHCLLRLLDVDIECYKGAQMRRRLEAFVRRYAGDAGSAEFCHLLETDDLLLSQLKKTLTIKVSEFFRDPEQFGRLRDSVLPELLRQRADIKVWSAGCARGQEPYSLAILLAEAFPGHSARILATDLDREALKVAAAGGPYAPESLRNVPDALREKYFEKDGEGYRVIRTLREGVEFRPQDLTRDAFSRGFDLVVCRNVLIYFATEARLRLARRLGQALAPHGVLFTGGSEALIGGACDGFERLSGNFYRLVGTVESGGTGTYQPPQEQPFTTAFEIRQREPYNRLRLNGLPGVADDGA